MAVERFLPSAIAHFEPADLIGALATGIVVLDSDLCVVYANVAAQDLLAVSVNQARGKPFLTLVLEADDGTDDQAILRAAMAAGPVHSFGLKVPDLTELFQDVVTSTTTEEA